MASLKTWDKVLRLCERRGFVYNVGPQSISYGPLGVELKRNLLNEWWSNIVTTTGNIYPICSPMIPSAIANPQSTSGIGSSNLRTQLLNPDLCNRVQEQVKPTLPYGIAEVGKVYQKRKDSTRVMETEVGALRYVCPRAQFKLSSTRWQRRRLQWWEMLAKNPNNFVLKKTEEDDDWKVIQFVSPDGCVVLEEHSAKYVEPSPSSSSDPAPYISISTMLDKAVLAFLCDAFTERAELSDSSKMQAVLQMHPSLAPYKLVVVSEEKDNHKLDLYARKLSEELRLAGIPTAMSPPGADLEEELVLHDEIGTCFRVIISNSTLETGAIEVMDRDTKIKEKIMDNTILDYFQFIHYRRSDDRATATT